MAGEPVEDKTSPPVGDAPAVMSVTVASENQRPDFAPLVAAAVTRATACPSSV